MVNNVIRRTLIEVAESGAWSAVKKGVEQLGQQDCDVASLRLTNKQLRACVLIAIKAFVVNYVTTYGYLERQGYLTAVGLEMYRTVKKSAIFSSNLLRSRYELRKLCRIKENYLSFGNFGVPSQFLNNVIVRWP